MAEAIGQLTGTPAVVMGTRAVGAGNMAIGIHTARQNSTPLVALLGQVGRGFRGRDAFQESDLVETPGALAKWAAEIDDPARAGGVIAAGLRAMNAGRPGPVLLSLPEDVLDLPAANGATDDRPTDQAAPDSAAVSAVLDLLDDCAAAADPGWRRRSRGRCDRRAADTRRAPGCAGDGRLAPTRRLSQRPPAVPRHDRLRLARDRASAHRVGGRAAGHRLSPERDRQLRVLDPAATTKWAHVDLEPRSAHDGLRAPDIAVATDAGLPACGIGAVAGGPPSARTSQPIVPPTLLLRSSTTASHGRDRAYTQARSSPRSTEYCPPTRP